MRRHHTAESLQNVSFTAAPCWGHSSVNTIGTPQRLKPAVQTELFIKTGLVTLGASLIFSDVLQEKLAGDVARATRKA